MIAQACLRVLGCSNKSKSVQAERKPKACFWLCRSAADFRGEASMSAVGSLFPTFDSARLVQTRGEPNLFELSRVQPRLAVEILFRPQRYGKDKKNTCYVAGTRSRYEFVYVAENQLRIFFNLSWNRSDFFWSSALFR